MRAGLDGWNRGAVASWLHRTGSTRPVREPVVEPYRLLLDGDPVGPPGPGADWAARMTRR
jgi:hypothetical protein